jgi:hypothetical protein
MAEKAQRHEDIHGVGAWAAVVDLVAAILVGAFSGLVHVKPQVAFTPDPRGVSRLHL